MGKMKYEVIGVDLGNSDTKSQDTSIPNGYVKYSSLPSMQKRKFLYYNNSYYCVNDKRFDFLEDKTKTERGIVLALCSISEQLLHKAKKKNLQTREEIQNYLNGVNTILLGVGLPLADINVKGKAKECEDYFYEYLKDGVIYQYENYEFSYRMEFCKCFPQNFAAIVVSGKNKIIRTYKKYHSVDLGGGTMDVLSFEDGEPVVANCFSEYVGILFMYEHIRKVIRQSFNLKLDNKDIEYILDEEEVIISEEVKNEVKRLVQQWVDEKIVDKLSQNNINFETAFILFLGGGAKRLEKYLKNNKLLKHIGFLNNSINANATGYAFMVKQCFEERNN